MEGVGKAFTPPSEANNFQFLKKARPLTHQFGSPICEMNQSNTNSDIPPSSTPYKKLKKRESLCRMDKNKLTSSSQRRHCHFPDCCVS